MQSVELGDKVKDTITGYSGIAIGITEWINGCRRVVIQSDKLKDGVPIEAQHIDEPQLTVIKRGAVKLPKRTDDHPGGPLAMPQRRPAVRR